MKKPAKIRTAEATEKRRLLRFRLRLARAGYGRKFEETSLQSLRDEGFKIEEEIQTLLKKGAQNPVVMDVGCGRGNALHELKTRYPNIHAIGISAKRYPEMNPQLDFKIMGFHQLTKRFPPNSVDLIYSHWGISTSSSEGQKEVLRQIHSILKPGGKIIFDHLNVKPSIKLQKMGFKVSLQQSGASAHRFIVTAEKTSGIKSFLARFFQPKVKK